MASTTPPVQAAVDSDIDLQDAVEHAKAQDQPQRGTPMSLAFGNLAALDSQGAITPALLAKHHLPGILLDHGPLAIRHIMGYLTTSVPGFSGIPPAKARRLVVGALEGRGSGGEGGGLHGDVEFEKVGWGRWDAKRRGQPAKDGRNIRHQNSLVVRHTSSTRRGSSPYAQRGLRIPRGNIRQGRARSGARNSHIASKDHPTLSNDTDMDYGNNSEDISMLENEADKMSLDDDGSCSSSDAPDESPILDDDIDEVTDEEDWASIGAAALRQGSFPLNSGGGRIYHQHITSTARIYSKDRGGGPRSSVLAKSMPVPRIHMASSQQQLLPQQQEQPQQRFNDFGGFVGLDGIGSDSQEREAIEALVRLSSV